MLKSFNQLQSRVLYKRVPNSPFSCIPAISLFSGGGGMDIGLEVAGFKTYCCVEKDPHSCITLRSNRDWGAKTDVHSFLEKAVVLEDNICNVSDKRILEATSLKKEDVSLVYGGPPCQAFSVFGKRKGLEDERGVLLWEFVRIVNELTPEAFILENVSGLKTYNQSSVFQQLQDRLSQSGKYTVSFHHYELADFGIPQFRKRIFLIGSRRGINVPPMTPTHGVLMKPYRTVREVLENLGEPGFINLPNHKGRVHSQRIIDRYASLEFGQRDPNTRINKLHPDRPSFTIVVGSDAGGGKGHIHPYMPREVTPRESARIQTFPDFWEFSGTSRHPIRQVGNAVPPLFAALLAAHIRKYLFDEMIALSYEDALNYLGLDYLKSNYA
ncbi:MAG: DNA cytosine methyltransferase [Lyngbya sp.]|nr:DNA cytosine methyltransferase [Lyngbya sp.]